jgi:hypothetical protein
MRKLLFAAVATAIVALQPTLALAQGPRQPGSGKDGVGATSPTTGISVTRQILQAIPVSATTLGIPPSSGFTTFTRCVVGTSNGVADGSFEHIRFVGNILCIDPGPNGDFASFALNCPSGTTPVIQGVKLIKTVPAVAKCPDVYPGATFVQTPATTGIRTWWMLKHSPPGTNFRLEVEVSCVGPDPGTGRQVVRAVLLNVFQFRVTITPDTLSWVVHALHNEPLGLCEIPCITDEALFQLLIDQSNTIRNEANAGFPRIRQLNTALDVMEATIVRRCLFLLGTWQVDANGRVLPCANINGGVPPSNFTVGSLGFGIVDTLENPCCCKLIADLAFLKLTLIGNDP